VNEGTEPDEATDRLFDECEPTPRKGELRDIRIGDLQRDVDAKVAAERPRQVEGMIKQFNAAWKKDLTAGVRPVNTAPPFKIDLKAGARLPRTVKMRRRSEEEKKTIDEFVTRMVAAGMLEPCRAPMASPLVLVKQKGKTRI
jgi:hypothetical protein